MTKDTTSTAPLILQRTGVKAVAPQTLTVMGLAALVFDNDAKIEYAILANSRADLKRITDRLKTKTEKVNDKAIYRCALMRAKDVTTVVPFQTWVDADPQAGQPDPVIEEDDDDLL